jgi:lipopolysaccharide/colanic/teichoic acid biosynthesis glycosyltransferase
MRIEYDNSMDQKTMKSYVEGEAGSFDKTHSRGIFKPPIEDNITRVGRYLRNTSLDELPQWFNIIKGNMSFVGPRPNVPWEVEAYKDWHYERLEVLPGITGIAQVSGRSSITFDELVSFDLKYVRNRSLRNDLLILWKTIWIVVRREGVG